MWVEKYSGGYRIRDRVSGKKIVLAEALPNKTVAKRAKEKLQAEKWLPPEETVTDDGTTVGEWVTEWWESHKKNVGTSTARTEGGRVKNHIVGRIGHCRLAELDEAAIRLWLGDLSEPAEEGVKPLAAKTILNIHGYLSMALDKAKARKLIAVNPCAESDLPKWHPPEPRFLSDAELGRLIRDCPDHWRPLVVFIAGTGCRISEALGLRQHRVDVIRGRVTFATQLSEQAGRLHEDVPLKTRYSRRTIGIGETVCNILAGMASVDEHAYVFTAPQGGPVHYSVLRRAWIRAFEDTEWEDFRFHDLRHTHASTLIRRGKHLTAIQRRLGHSSIQVTSDLYGHLDQEVDDGVVEAVEDTFAAAGLGGIVGAPDGNRVQSDAMTSNDGKKKPQVER